MKIKDLLESKYDETGELKNTTPEKSVKWLEKTKNSIFSDSMKGGSPRKIRGSELCMRYNDHKSWLLKNSPKHWEEYCKKNRFDVDHDARDMYA